MHGATSRQVAWDGARGLGGSCCKERLAQGDTDHPPGPRGMSYWRKGVPRAEGTPSPGFSKGEGEALLGSIPAGATEGRDHWGSL